MPGFGHPRKRRLGFQGVYRIAPGGGDPELIVGRDEFEMPNGICFNPDETLFYINDTPGAYIKVYDADAGRERSRTAACSSRASAPASSRRASRTG